MFNLRIAKIILVFLPSLQMFQIALTNAFNFSGVLRETGFVLGMTGTPEALKGMLWRATDNPVMVYGGSFFIVGTEFLMACLLAIGGYQMWKARALDKAVFNKSKKFVIWGCLAGVVLFYGGFLTIAGNWFFVWTTPTAGALETAYRYATILLLIMIFVAETNHD